VKDTAKRLEKLEAATQPPGEILVFTQDLDDPTGDLYWRQLKDGSRQSFTRAEIKALDAGGPVILVEYVKGRRPEAQQGAESLAVGK
jgi:hypothetical protein